MDHRIPRIGAAISVLLAIGALITFVFLNNRFEGPDPTSFLTNPYELTAEFENTKTLPTKQPVLHKGIAVGRVNAVDYDSQKQVGVVTFTLDDDFPIYEDAVLTIGERSLLGDAYLNLLERGTPEAGRLEAGDEVTMTERSVNFDEALDFLDEEGRDRLSSLIDTIADGASRSGNGERLNGTIGGLSRTIQEARQLTRTLRGQEQDIADLVATSATVLSEIGSREQAVRTIVGSGRVTLDALGSNTASLDEALTELPRLLDSGRATLADAEPLLTAARPLAADLREAAPFVRRAFDPDARHPLSEVNADLIQTIQALSPLRRQAERVLPKVTELNTALAPLTKQIAPASRNLVPALDYLTPRVETISSLYALLGAATANRDEVGHYLRVGLISDPNETFDSPAPADCDPETQNDPPNEGYCWNPYPEPPNPADGGVPQPFSGTYPRLVPCEVPSRENPKQPCE